MDGELIKKALCFHGKPMQKIWDDERGAGDLQMSGVPEDGNYSIYMERQKYFTFQDRAKRLKLHQFLARKAIDLYDKDLSKIPVNPIKLEVDTDDKFSNPMAILPPYETFLSKHHEEIKVCTLEAIQAGDIVYAQVIRGKTGTGFHLNVKPLCTEGNNFKLLHDFKIKSIIPSQLCANPVLEKLGYSHVLEPNDYVRCEVFDAQRMTLSLTPSNNNKNIKLGKIKPDELPTLYNKLVENSVVESYEGYLTKAKEFDNPNYDILYAINGLNVHDNLTLMSSLKNGFPAKEYAKELRQQQASKWAFRSVADGIEYFKIGQHVEAFQCLNKALNIDPRNVEGLVARGALYANKGSFLKAVEDFEKALNLNKHHVNARKYMGETLVALGRSYEEDNRIQDAAKAYRDCLNIIPQHDQATMLLEAIQQRTGASVEVIPPPPGGKLFETPEVKISPTNGTDTEDSSSDSDSDSADENVASRNRNPSLSPLSKKLALHAQQMESTGQQPFQLPFYMSAENESLSAIANEFKLDEDDMESRVRKLLQDASKHKKDKKKTKKSKKSKKSKKTSKTTPSKISIKPSSGHTEYTYVINAESTLNANLKQYEKSIEELKKRQKLLVQPSTSSLDHRSRRREKSETPPPPPSMNFSLGQGISAGNSEANNKLRTINFGQSTQTAATSGTAAAAAAAAQQKLSFQIKKPVKIDKFGLIRLATPALKKSPSLEPSPTKRGYRPRSRQRSNSGQRSRSRSDRHSHSRRRSRSRTRSNSRSRRRNRSVSRSRSGSVGRRSSHWHSRQRSRSRDRYEKRGRSSHYSRSPSTRSGSVSHRRRHDRRSRSRSDDRRRTPSPFVPRGTPSPSRRYRRSHSPRGGFRGGWRGRGRGRGIGGSSYKFGNRVWKNPNKEDSPDLANKPSSADQRWLHDKFESANDDPTIEEIDEIISKAQKERKQNIINNDKNILKKKANKW